MKQIVFRKKGNYFSNTERHFEVNFKLSQRASHEHDGLRVVTFFTSVLRKNASHRAANGEVMIPDNFNFQYGHPYHFSIKNLLLAFYNHSHKCWKKCLHAFCPSLPLCNVDKKTFILRKCVSPFSKAERGERIVTDNVLNSCCDHYFNSCFTN